MQPRNKYVNRSRISEKKFRQLIRMFALDLEATKVVEITGLNRNTINRYFMEIRKRIARLCEQESPFHGTVKVDESYFEPRRIKGKRGRGAGSKIIVFGIFKRNGKVYTEIVPDAKKRTLQAIIRGRVESESVIHSDTWRGYAGLVDLGYKKHYRVHHGIGEFAKNNNIHINGIESFWGATKTRLSKRRGIRKDLFYLHLKECEFRFNYRHTNLYQKLLEIFRKDPLC